MPTLNPVPLPHSVSPNSGAPFDMPVVMRRSLQGVVLALLLLNALVVLLSTPGVTNHRTVMDQQKSAPPGSSQALPRSVSTRVHTNDTWKFELTASSDWEVVTSLFDGVALAIRNRQEDLVIIVAPESRPQPGDAYSDLDDYNALAANALQQQIPGIALVKSQPIQVGGYSARENEFDLAAKDAQLFALQTIIATPDRYFDLRCIGHATKATAHQALIRDVIRTFRTTGPTQATSPENPSSCL